MTTRRFVSVLLIYATGIIHDLRTSVLEIIPSAGSSVGRNIPVFIVYLNGRHFRSLNIVLLTISLRLISYVLIMLLSDSHSGAARISRPGLLLIDRGKRLFPSILFHMGLSTLQIFSYHLVLDNSPNSARL